MISMKIFILVLLLFTNLVLISSCGESRYFLKSEDTYENKLTQGLIAYYPCNGNVKDESGKSNNAVNHNTTFTLDRFNHPNSACEFNGSDSYIEVFHIDDFNIGVNGSISFWVKYYGGTGTLFWKRNYNGSNGWTIYFGFPNEIIVYTNQSASFIRVGNIPAENKWHHIVINNEYGNVSVHFDGQKVIEKAISSFESTNENLLIGRDEIGNYFTGCLDDIRFYKRALSKEEINALYNK